jgi:polar amino acid transport system permease protein
MTIQLTVLTVLFGSIIGIIAALMALSESAIPKILSAGYIWIFRGTPLLVQIIFFYNLALFIPTFGIGRFSISTNSIMSPYFTALLSLGLYQGAYMAEIIRGGILSVPIGQKEAALSQGMSSSQTMWQIILPQSMRVIIPATGNQAIAILKSTALVSVIAAKDLLTQAQIIYYGNYLIIELLIVASIWYLVLTTIGSIGQSFLEDKYSAGAEKTKRENLLKRIYTNLVPRKFQIKGGA